MCRVTVSGRKVKCQGRESRFKFMPVRYVASSLLDRITSYLAYVHLGSMCRAPFSR